MHHSLLNLEPLISLKSAISEGYIPISESNYYDGVANGKYPPPIKIGKRNFLTETILREIRGEPLEGVEPSSKIELEDGGGPYGESQKAC